LTAKEKLDDDILIKKSILKEINLNNVCKG